MGRETKIRFLSSYITDDSNQHKFKKKRNFFSLFSVKRQEIFFTEEKNFLGINVKKDFFSKQKNLIALFLFM